MKNFKKNIQTVGIGAVGAIAGKAVKNKLVPMIPGVGQNELVKSFAPALVGLYLMDNKNSMLADLGTGMAISAVADYASAKIPGIGEITGDDLTAVAAEVIEGLDDNIDEILRVGDDMGDDFEDLGDDFEDLGDDFEDLGDDMELED